ncbi:MAG: META domain-containing protein [Alistipes sp.]|nr:META domain-containing protein [Alistipes sp.]
MTKSIKIILAIICTTILVGCCSACRQRQKNAKPLKGTEWHLVQMEGRDMTLPRESFNITMAEDGSLAGVGACNRLLGQYTVSENYSISFGQVGTTMMLCPENGELESRFTQLLGAVTHYDIDGNKLILLQGGAIKAIFEALPASEK